MDLETDAAIQKAIRTEFADATCLTVAHRYEERDIFNYLLIRI